MLYYFKKGKNSTEMPLWRRCCDWSKVSKVAVQFCAGDFSLEDAPWLGRAVEVDSDQIKNNHYSMQEIADMLKISKSIKLLVNMKNMSFMEKI